MHQHASHHQLTTSIEQCAFSRLQDSTENFHRTTRAQRQNLPRNDRSYRSLDPGVATKCPQQILVLILVPIIVSLHRCLDPRRDPRRQRAGRRSRRRWGPTTIKTRIGTRIRCRTENIQRVGRYRQPIPPVISTNPLFHLQGAVEHGAFACLHRDFDHLVAIANRAGAGGL